MSKRRPDRHVAAAALLFAALGDPTRLTLLERLSHDGPASISALASQFRGMSRQGVTKHLQVLADAGVISVPGSQCVVRVERTDEDLVIARHTRALVAR